MGISQTRKGRIYYGWWMLLSSMFTIACGGFMLYGLPAYYPALLKQFGWTRTSLAFGFTVMLIGNAVMKLFYGMMTDKKGARPSLMLGTVLCGTGFAGFGFVNSIYYFYAVCWLFGLGYAGMALVPNTSLMTRWFVRKRGTAMGLITAADIGGGAIALPALTYLISKLGGPTTFVLLGSAMLVFPLILIKTVMRERPEQIGLHPDGLPEAPQEIQPIAATSEAAFLAILRKPGFWFIIASLFLSGAYIYAILQHLILYLRGLGFAPYLAAGIASMELGFSVIGRLAFGYLNDILSIRRTSAASFLLLLISSVLILFAHIPGVIYVFAICNGLGHGGVAAFIPIVFAAIFPSQHVGKGIALGFLAFVIGAAVGSPFAGYIFDRTGTYHYAFLVNVALILVAAMIMVVNLGSASSVAVVDAQIKQPIY